MLVHHFPGTGVEFQLAEVGAWHFLDERLLARGGSPTRNIERRLAWKRSRGIDTTAEEQACGLRPKEPI